jgi:two-component system OmpR family response regulator
MLPITRTFFFMTLSNACATEMSVAVRIGGGGFHPSFSGTRFFVTKCVNRSARHNPTHIPGSRPEALVYIYAMQAAPHILVVDDHREIRDLVSRVLTKEGFRVSMAADGRAMHKILADSRTDLILLDLMLPGEDGLSLCRSLRAESNIPIIMLTAKGEEVDRVIGLEMGADDYLPKPFGSRELIARIRAVLRRSHEKMGTLNSDVRPKRYHFGRWGLDTGARELLRDDGVTVPLSTGEYDLLIVLVQRPQRVLSRDQLLDLARGRVANALDRSIDTQVSRLRKKLELDPGDPKIIRTVWGGGYIFTPAVSHE